MSGSQKRSEAQQRKIKKEKADRKRDASRSANERMRARRQARRQRQAWIVVGLAVVGLAVLFYLQSESGRQLASLVMAVLQGGGHTR